MGCYCNYLRLLYLGIQGNVLDIYDILDIFKFHAMFNRNTNRFSPNLMWNFNVCRYVLLFLNRHECLLRVVNHVGSASGAQG